jgi:hypothetical protein
MGNSKGMGQSAYYEKLREQITTFKLKGRLCNYHILKREKVQLSLKILFSSLNFVRLSLFVTKL